MSRGSVLPAAGRPARPPAHPARAAWAGAGLAGAVLAASLLTGCAGAGQPASGGIVTRGAAAAEASWPAPGSAGGAGLSAPTAPPSSPSSPSSPASAPGPRTPAATERPAPPVPQASRDDPVGVARAFVVALLSYRWDSTQQERRDAFAPWVTAAWLALFDEGPGGRETAAWREFVTGHGVVRAEIRHAAVSDDAPNTPTTVWVQVVADEITTGDTTPEERGTNPMNIRLVLGGDGWRVAQAVDI